jgi:hypothetical protein
MTKFKFPLALLAVGAIGFVLFDGAFALIAQTLLIAGAMWRDHLRPQKQPWDHPMNWRPEDEQ